MKAKLNDAQARAYIAGESSEPVQEIERKHILLLVSALQEAAERPGMNLANLGKTADRYVENHQNTENRQELSLLTATRDAIKAEGNSLGGFFLPERGRGGKGDYRGIRGRGCVFPRCVYMAERVYRVRAQKTAGIGGERKRPRPW